MSNQFRNGYALIIGINESQVEEWALPDVAKDVTALEEILKHPERCGYPDENVEVMMGPKPTRQEILNGLRRLRNKISVDNSGNATAIVYYSGHGERYGNNPAQYYLIPYDVDREAVKSSALKAEDFADAIDALKPQRLLVVLDCCRSGGMGIKGLADYANSSIPPQLFLSEGDAVTSIEGSKGLETLAKGTGRAVLSSSKGEQYSYMRKDGQMSIFTFHLKEALTGHAQPQEGATEVLISDVMSYVHRKVPKTAKHDWKEEQDPDYLVSGNFPIALLLGGKGIAKGQAAPDPLQPLPEVHIGHKFEEARDVFAPYVIASNINEMAQTKIGGDVLKNGDKYEVHYGGGEKGIRDLGGSRATPTDKIGKGSDATSAGIADFSQPSKDTSMQKATEPKRTPDPEFVDNALKPVLQKLIAESPTRGLGPEWRQLFELSTELVRGNEADPEHVAKLVEGLVMVVPGITNELEQLFALRAFERLAPVSWQRGKENTTNTD